MVKIPSCRTLSGLLPVTEINGKKKPLLNSVASVTANFMVVNLSFPYAGIIQIRWF